MYAEGSLCGCSLPTIVLHRQSSGFLQTQVSGHLSCSAQSTGVVVVFIAYTCSACHDWEVSVNYRLIDSVSSTDNTGLFRDVKKRGKRRVLELDPAGRKIVEASPFCMAAAAWKRQLQDVRCFANAFMWHCSIV